MKRTTALVALAGAVVLLAGCGSTTGTAAPATSAPSSTAVSSSASEAPPASSADTGSASSSSDTGSSSEPSAESSAGGPTTTIGDTSGGLDEQSTKWFDTFCMGVAPLAELSSLGTSLQTGGATDMKAVQKSVVDSFTKTGAAFTSTAEALKDLPPPTFSGGGEFAAAAVPALAAFGATLTKAAAAAAAADVTKDPTSLTTAMSSLATDMQAVTGPLSNLKVTPQTEAAIGAIPSCKAIPGLNLGGG